MSPSAIAATALAVVLFFWVIGAYNRLVAMRNAILAAWVKVHQAIDQRGPALPPLLATLRGSMSAEQVALDAWQQSQSQAAQAASAMGLRPLAASAALGWVVAEAGLDAAANRVLALLEQQPDLAAEAAPLVGAWRESQARLPFVRQVYNEAAGSYNAALAAFPTYLVARAFGLGPAGLI